MSIIKRTLLSAIGDRFLDEVKVADVVEVSRNFRFIELEAEVFKATEFSVGEKIQINVGDWNMRTYTPLSINRESGRLGILAYLHGKGPGSDWALTVRSGDQCRALGPRPSLRLAPSDGSLIFFGDETAIGVAAGLKRKSRSRVSVQLFFEASSPEETSSILKGLGLKDYAVFPKGENGLISNDLEHAVLAAVQPTSQVLLMGRAQSIQIMHRQLKAQSFPMSSVITKSYWSENKAGLD
jgi:NADPH-dependent ferric siderophore reductase